MKVKKCKVCKTPFTPTKPMQCVCGLDCALSMVATKKAKQGAIQARTEALRDKAKREQLKTRADWAKEAQAAFNRWVRLRDMGKPCISCGRHHKGQIHAGHYLSRGAHPELAYHPDNCHAQCAPCNTYLSGNAAAYRINLVRLIGVERVEALEGPQQPSNHTTADLMAIRDNYRAKCKAIEKNSNVSI